MVGSAAVVYWVDLAFALAAQVYLESMVSIATASDSAVDSAGFAVSTDQNSTEMNCYCWAYSSMTNQQTTSCLKMIAISTFQIGQIGQIDPLEMNCSSLTGLPTSVLELDSAPVEVPALASAWAWYPRE